MTSVQTPDRQLTWKDGLQAVLPVAAGYIPIAIAFGVLANSLAIPRGITLSMSVFVFAGASQFMGVQLLAAGASAAQVILATFILNLRHLLMSASLSRRIDPHTPTWLRTIISFGITDETFAINSLRPEGLLSISFVLTVNILAYLSWVLGTVFGVLLGENLPVTVQNSMGIALYAMFIGLLVPAARRTRRILMVAALAMVVHSIIKWCPLFSGLSLGWGVVIATLVASAVGAWLFPQGVEP